LYARPRVRRGGSDRDSLGSYSRAAGGASGAIIMNPAYDDWQVHEAGTVREAKEKQKWDSCSTQIS